MVTRSVINERYDEASNKRREELAKLEGSEESIALIDRISRPSGNGPVPGDLTAMQGYAAEINVILVKALVAQQGRIMTLEARRKK